MSELFDAEYRLQKPLRKNKKPFWLISKLRRLARQSVISHMGVKLYVDRKLLTKKEIRGLYKGGHEDAECRILSTIIEPSDKIVEIGAGFGMTGILCAKIAGEKNVMCFEANDELKPLIEKNAALNHVKLHVQYAPVTVDGGMCEFYRTATLIGSGTAKTNATVQTYQKQSVALRDVLEQYKPNTLVMDVEGSESDLLQQPLPGVCKILVEIHPHKTPNASLGKMMQSLLAQGFVQVHDMTLDKSLFFYRSAA